MPLRDDFLMRTIQQVAASLKRVRERLLGNPTEDELLAIDREAGDAVATLLGPQAPLLQAIDPGSATALLDADRVALWVALLESRTAAARARGDDAQAVRLAARTLALSSAASARWPEWRRLE